MSPSNIGGINIDNYLTIEALEDGLTAKLSSNVCEYCIDGDGVWKPLPVFAETESIKSGQTLSFRANSVVNSSIGIGTFTISKKCNLLGNCMSMLFGDNAESNFSLSGKNYAFRKLFYNGSTIIEVSENFLHATNLAVGCYAYMFQGCTSLTTAPKLPATTLSNNCYRYMFSGCTVLTKLPELPATILADSCYYYMFENCRATLTAPQLPATSLSPSCYFAMFKDCRNLSEAPELPAKNLSSSCYQGMFQTCTSLIEAPELPATNLANNCYLGMFGYCTKLRIAPELPSENIRSQCYYSMFQYCTSLEVAPVLPAEHLYSSCYNYMFRGCEKLNYIKAMCLTSLGSGISEGWLEGVSSTGTFVKNKDATWDVTGVNGVPEGWTAITDEEVQENTITFYISDEIDEPYKIICKEGMTWSEFVNSVYAQGLDVFSNFELVSYGSYYGIRVYHKLADWTMTLYNDSSFEITTDSTEQIIDGKIYYCH